MGTIVARFAVPRRDAGLTGRLLYKLGETEYHTICAARATDRVTLSTLARFSSDAGTNLSPRHVVGDRAVLLG
jgi:hypothetical protein